MEESLNEFQFRRKYNYVKPPKVDLRERVENAMNWNNFSWKNVLFSFLPILTWLPNYSLKGDLPGDIIGGITTAIVRIPQSLAYGLLAGLDPISGVYTAFFSPIVYGFLGTSRHVSVGTFSVLSLMLGTAQEKVLSSQTSFPLTDGNGTAFDPESVDYKAYKLSITVSLTLLVGLIQILLGFLHLGFVSLLLSDPLISGFTTGSAVYVVATQLKYVFGIDLERHSSPFSLFKLLYELISKITLISWAEVIVSLITFVALYPIKLINIKYKKKLRNIPIPMELIIVVVATVISSLVDLPALYNINTVGNVPKGVPAPTVPTTTYWVPLLSDAVSIAIVSFAITVSIGKLFAKKHNYKIVPNQELFALGVSQLACAFFSGHACSGGLARSSVKESSGSNTQLSDFVSSAIILLVLLVLAPYLANLPKACLSVIIIVNIRTLFRQFLRLPHLWRLCPYDFFIWILTFTTTIVFGVDMGLILGIFGLLLSLALQRYFSAAQVLGRVAMTSYYRRTGSYKEVEELDNVKVIKMPDAPFFGNMKALEHIAKEIASLKQQRASKDETPKPRLADEQMELTSPLVSEANGHVDDDVDKLRHGTSRDDVEASVLTDADAASTKSSPAPPFTLVFDCASWFYIDSMGIEALQQVCKEMKEIQVRVFFAELQTNIFEKLEQVELFNEEERGDVLPFPSLHHAVTHAQNPATPAKV